MIILSSDAHGGIADVQNWLDFNRIDYACETFWVTDSQSYAFNPEINHSVVICNIDVLMQFVRKQSPQDQLLSLLRRFNQLWIVGLDVGSVYTFGSSLGAFLRAIDSEIPPHSIILMMDGEPTDRYYLSDLRHVQIMVIPAFYTRLPVRINGNEIYKSNARYAFLLTMRRKAKRYHRDVLWKALCLHPNVMAAGLIASGIKQNSADYTTLAGNSQWLGATTHEHSVLGLHASMDLYLDAFIEIVPETLYRDLYYLTEKTIKPIMTQTPFLMVSNAGYLAWLKQQGFQTFYSLIDERYDLHYRVEDRVQHMMSVLTDILRTGAQSFYEASRPILQHNFDHLCEMNGSWWHRFDNAMWQALENSKKMLR